LSFLWARPETESEGESRESQEEAYSAVKPMILDTNNAKAWPKRSNLTFHRLQFKAIQNDPVAGFRHVSLDASYPTLQQMFIVTYVILTLRAFVHRLA
jgi:hypothetical protein